LFAIAAFYSCGSKQQVEYSDQSAVDTKEQTDIAKERDKQFLFTATDFYFQQILLGKLAQTRAGLPEIKELGRLLEESSRETKSKVASLGFLKSIAVPSAPPQTAHAAYEAMNAVVVENFDIDYLRDVIQRHQAAINLFESATIGNYTSEVRTLATAILPELRSNMSKAIQLDAQMNAVSVTEVAP
jgi:uncharacterized protein (DUF305 family)